MPRRTDLSTIMVIGSGPIVIGQAAEFDYAGTQACRALTEEGYRVVLVNSNPATIMTDPGIADRIYIEPLTPGILESIIAKERPDGLLATLGGQVGLNLAVRLNEAGILQKYDVELLGTPIESIQQAEDRAQFRALMLEMGEPMPPSTVVHTFEEGQAFANQIGYPLIVRPAFTLGGSGGGLVYDEPQLREVLSRGLTMSPISQALLEQSIAGWKELEYEVMRDLQGTVLTICNMENIDPLGIHTGDSIVVAPAQTLPDRVHQRLRSAALRIISALKVAGGCNIQFALSPDDQDYCVIEVNPRVSRSSALASKATGYPIARIAAKIAVGLSLAEIPNPITGKTRAAFEPTLDYAVVKIPRWPFDKFPQADRRLGTEMRSTGEVMAIDRSFRAALLKAIRGLEAGYEGLDAGPLAELSDEELQPFLSRADDRRLFAVAEALRRGQSIEQVFQSTKISPFFLREIQLLIFLERRARCEHLTPELLRALKENGFSDRLVARLTGLQEQDIAAKRDAWEIQPVFKMVDTCAAEFDAETPYFYSTYDQEDESGAKVENTDGSVLVLGAGPIRIGQGIEFDYSSVKALSALRSMGIRSVMLNANPETVSTDFSESDRLVFEPVRREEVLAISRVEPLRGVLVQFGGQTAINLAADLVAAGLPILGTPLEGIRAAEDRRLFDRLLNQLEIPRPQGLTAERLEQVGEIAKTLGYPVLIRPSFVLGGRAMAILRNDEELERYIAEHSKYGGLVPPILIDAYLEGTEVEVDAVSDGTDVLVIGIMEHIERAGVHSGDSTAVYPARSLSPVQRAQILSYTKRLALALQTVGLINIQFVIQGERVLMLEANPRASRTVPFLSKATGLPVVDIATRAILGQSLRQQGYGDGAWPDSPFVAVKCPVFSWSKMRSVDAFLGPEMKSTGEVMGFGQDYPEAMLKAFMAAGIGVTQGPVLLAVSDRDKTELLPLAQRLHALGRPLLATPGTRAALARAGLASTEFSLRSADETLVKSLKDQGVSLVINTLTRGASKRSNGFRLRRLAAEHGSACLTSLDTAGALIEGLEHHRALEPWHVQALGDYLAIQ